MSDQNNSNDIADMLNQAAAPRKGNEVFASDGIEKVTRQEYVKKELGFELPTHTLPLPSQGLLYPAGHALHQATSVDIRAMTAKEEDILMNRALIKKGTVITELIRSCLVNKAIDVSSLISGDRNALMVAIRSSGYGSEYSPTFQCPKCEHTNQMHVELADLEIKPLTLQPARVGENVFKFKLPVSKLEVDFCFLTGEQEEKIVKAAEFKKNKGLAESTITTRYMNQILAVNGNTEPGVISKFVNNMPARDSLELRKFIDKHEPGVKMEVDFQCESCSYADTIALPMDVSFFWPGSK